MKKKITAILAMCMLAVTMAACGDSDVSDDYSEPDNAASAEVEDAGEADEAEASDDGEAADSSTSGEFTLLDVHSSFGHTYGLTFRIQPGRFGRCYLRNIYS